jgi:hypothetical protein
MLNSVKAGCITAILMQDKGENAIINEKDG